MELIELNNVTKIFGKSDYKTVALQNISLQISVGQFVSIMGPSGSGKTTLLNIIGCMDVPTTGDFWINGKNTSALTDSQISNIRNKSVSFIFQHFALLQNYSVFDNVALPLFKREMKARERKEKVMYYLEKMGIANLTPKNVSKLSGGQKQRVAIARALAAETEIILADEPTGALDKKNGEELMNILSTINNEGKTVVVITHDDNIAEYTKRKIQISDGVIIFDSLSGGEKKI